MFYQTRLGCAAMAAFWVAAVPAQAQSTVTVYGLLDIGPARFSRTTAGDSGMSKLNSDTGSSSRLGFRGAEDLGGAGRPSST